MFSSHSLLRKYLILIKRLYKKVDKSECVNYRGISLVSLGSKVFSMMILVRLRDAAERVLREEQRGFRRCRGCVDQTFILRLIIEKCLSHQTPLVLSFIDYEQAFDSADRRALATGFPSLVYQTIQTVRGNELL